MLIFNHQNTKISFRKIFICIIFWCFPLYLKFSLNIYWKFSNITQKKKNLLRKLLKSYQKRYISNLTYLLFPNAISRQKYAWILANIFCQASYNPKNFCELGSRVRIVFAPLDRAAMFRRQSVCGFIPLSFVPNFPFTCTAIRHAYLPREPREIRKVPR